MRARTVVKRSSPPHDTSAYFFRSVLVFEVAILGEYFSSVESLMYIAGLLVWPQAGGTLGRNSAGDPDSSA